LRSADRSGRLGSDGGAVFFLGREGGGELLAGVLLLLGAGFGAVFFALDDFEPALFVLLEAGLLLGGVDFKALKVIMKSPVVDSTGKVISEAVTLNYGNFLQTTFDFLIIAVCIFLLVKAINSFKKKEEEKPAEPKEEVVLLKEIRDALTKK